MNTTPDTELEISMPALETLRPLPADAYRLSVVLPVYSETDSVRAIVDWLRTHFGSLLEEIIIVQSPRSSTESRDLCQRLAEQDERVRLHVQQVNPGLGNAVREGLALTRGNLVLMMDSDGEMEIETLIRMFAAMAAGDPAMVVASRWSRGGGFTGYNPFKYWLNWGFQQLFRALFWTRVHDLTYGFKLMRGELARGIVWEGTLHEIACETTLKPIRLGLKVIDVPSKWTARVQGASKNSFFRNFRYVATALNVLVGGVRMREPASERETTSTAAIPAAR
jgi:glycosyltransferase involved in cell wall biosynthesis